MLNPLHQRRRFEVPVVQPANSIRDFKSKSGSSLLIFARAHCLSESLLKCPLSRSANFGKWARGEYATKWLPVKRVFWCLQTAVLGDWNNQHRLVLKTWVEKHEALRQTGNHSRSVFLVLRRRIGAEPSDRSTARGLQHEACWLQRLAGAQRLSADHPSSGRSLDRLYRPSRRHRRDSKPG